MAETLYLAAMLGHLSTSKRTNETQPTWSDSWSYTGAIALQGPHHVCEHSQRHCQCLDGQEPENDGLCGQRKHRR